MEIISNVISYASLIVLILSIVITAINTFITFINKAKTKQLKEESQTNEEIKTELEETKSEYAGVEKLTQLLTNTLPEAIKMAENAGVASGQAKQLLALSQVVLKCNEEGIDYAANKDTIVKTLEDLITFSKEVNVKPKEF